MARNNPCLLCTHYYAYKVTRHNMTGIETTLYCDPENLTTPNNYSLYDMEVCGEKCKYYKEVGKIRAFFRKLFS